MVRRPDRRGLVALALTCLLALVMGQTIGARQSVAEPRRAWTLDRSQFAGLILVVVLQTTLIVTLLVQRERRMRIERELEDEQRRYALATAAGAVGVWDWNFVTNELFVDTRLKSLLGFEDAEITRSPEDWGSRVHPDDVPAAAALVNACMTGESDVYEIEHRMLHKDGSVRWFLSRVASSADFRAVMSTFVPTRR